MKTLIYLSLSQSTHVVMGTEFFGIIFRKMIPENGSPWEIALENATARRVL